MNGETLGVQRWLARWAREPYTYLATNGYWAMDDREAIKVMAQP